MYLKESGSCTVITLLVLSSVLQICKTKPETESAFAIIINKSFYKI